MFYYKVINSVLGPITMVSDEDYLWAVWLEGQQEEKKYNLSECMCKDTPILLKTEHWLKQYFAKENPSIKDIPFKLDGTVFQNKVWELLCQIPYGTTVSYKDLAQEVAKYFHKDKMSAQAIGGAVGRNPIAILIPCHRVIGKNGSLVGYGGGLHYKEFLLQHENT